jgi:hypothetical protein
MPSRNWSLDHIPKRRCRGLVSTGGEGTIRFIASGAGVAVATSDHRTTNTMLTNANILDSLESLNAWKQKSTTRVLKHGVELTPETLNNKPFNP